MYKFRALVAAASALAVSLAAVDVAQAACTRLAFSVNDYGKEGPIRDAKSMLDKYIAKWAADRKIKVSSVGPKEVTCELFLDVIVFDEYTCKAAATVCWNGPMPAGHQVEADPNAPLVNKAKAAAPKAGADAGSTKQGATPIATGSVKAAPAAAPKQTAPAPSTAATKASAPAAAAPAAVAPAAPAPAAPAAN